MEELAVVGSLALMHSFDIEFNHTAYRGDEALHAFIHHEINYTVRGGAIV